jgi:hypothetical protein
VAEKNPGLREVSLRPLPDAGTPGGHLQASGLQSLLTSCSSLTKLDLSAGTILDQQKLDVLLDYGRQVTHLACGSFSLKESRASRECR